MWNCQIGDSDALMHGALGGHPSRLEERGRVIRLAVGTLEAPSSTQTCKSSSADCWHRDLGRRGRLRFAGSPIDEACGLSMDRLHPPTLAQGEGADSDSLEAAGAAASSKDGELSYASPGDPLQRAPTDADAGLEAGMQVSWKGSRPSRLHACCAVAGSLLGGLPSCALPPPPSGLSTGNAALPDLVSLACSMPSSSSRLLVKQAGKDTVSEISPCCSRADPVAAELPLAASVPLVPTDVVRCRGCAGATLSHVCIKSPAGTRSAAVQSIAHASSVLRLRDGS